MLSWAARTTQEPDFHGKVSPAVVCASPECRCGRQTRTARRCHTCHRLTWPHMLLLNVIVIVTTDHLYLSKNFRAWLQRSSVMVVRSETKRKMKTEFQILWKEHLWGLVQGEELVFRTMTEDILWYKEASHSWQFYCTWQCSLSNQKICRTSSQIQCSTLWPVL